MPEHKPRWRHYFSAPISGFFDSEHKDFDDAINALLPIRGTALECVQTLLEHTSGADYTIQNIEQIDMGCSPNPKPLED